MGVLEYSKTSVPPRRRRFAVTGFWLAVASFAITMIYVANLVRMVRGGEVGVTFRLSLVLHAVPVLACVLCLIGWSGSQRRLSLAGIALAVVSFTAIVIMGSRFWP